MVSVLTMRPNSILLVLLVNCLLWPLGSPVLHDIALTCVLVIQFNQINNVLSQLVDFCAVYSG
jgi:hypothetical protein